MFYIIIINVCKFTCLYQTASYNMIQFTNASSSHTVIQVSIKRLALTPLSIDSVHDGRPEILSNDPS